MRKRVMAFATAWGFMLTGSNASAVEDLYVSGFLGLNILSDSDIGGGDELIYDVGAALSGAVGFSAMPNVRVEGELAYRFNDIDEFCSGGFCVPAGDSMDAFSIMANGFYDFDFSAGWRPYLGGGIGLAVVTVETGGLEDDDTVFAVQFGGGVGIDIDERMVVTVDYRLFVTEDPSFGGFRFSSEYLAHTLAVGLRYHF